MASIECYWDHFKLTQTASNQRAGTIAAEVRNSRRTKRSDRIWKWSDFFRDLTQPIIQSAEAILSKFSSFASLFR